MSVPENYRRNCEILAGKSLPEGMCRIAMGVEYNGADFRGFQKQSSGVRTVQQELERALSHIANEEVTLVCAGRTDAGVHATGQVIHFDTAAVRGERNWLLGANTQLPPSISVRWARQVPGQFHARFSALSRRYRYVIYSGLARPALQHDQLTWARRPLNLAAMQAAAQYLVGEHDFTSYRAVQCQAHSPVRTLHQLNVVARDQLIIIEPYANAFLHHMVRNIAGVLMAIGAGDAEPVWAKQVLDARNRCAGGVTASPKGLYLVDVEYSDDFGLPEMAIGPHFLPDNLF